MLTLHWCFSVFFVAHTIILHSLFHSSPGNPFPYREVPISFSSVPCFHLGRSVTTMGCSKRRGWGKKPPSSPSVIFDDGIPIESNVVPSPSVPLVIDGFPIRAIPHLEADAEIGSPDAPPDPERPEDSEVPIRAIPHLAADAEIGSPNAPPDPERHEDSEAPIRLMPHLATDAEVGSPNAPPAPECHEDPEDARGSSLSLSVL
jgi:hypothetical protein